MNSVEAEGRTIEEAVAAALAQLQVERERVEIEVLSQATRGFLGIGGKKARIRATLRVPLSQQLAAASGQTAGRKKETARTPETAAPTVIEETEAAFPSREQGEKASEVLKEILRYMEVDATVALEQRGNEFVLTLAGKDSGALIGRNGQTLDALEYVLNRIVTRSEESDAHLTLDAEGYRERRRKNLENLALRLGERAKRRKKTITLSPLSPRDRRVIHLALEGDPLVTTRSMGRGYFRRLYIVPEEGVRRERGRGGPRMPANE
ncbi:MAG TPA: RNA-binding cell elongation regulator Jag/EloR [Methylomirabilota bacterium]|jgi:spoIIIJ-associated protein|nr:RNA-binding cell elongation regulator Jag/EloR [Methylomirabilota bacterium]